MDDKTRLQIFFPLAGFLVAAAFGVGLISMAVFDSDETVAASAEGGTSPTEEQTVAVELGDLFIKPRTIEVGAGDVTFEVKNSGASEHNFAVEDLGATEMIASGKSATLEISGLEPGKYEVICQVPGHAEGGMTGTLVVTEGAPTNAGGGSDHSEHAAMSAEEMAEHDAAVTGSFPAKTEGKGGTLLEPEIADDGTRLYKLTADEIEWETEPGKVVEAWAYNGIVPGPTIEAHLGDRIRIDLTNKLAEPTTMHFHGMTVPADMDGVPVISQDPIMPGDTFSYEFEIKNTGSNMYHSHFDAQKQVPMGLLGPLIVPDEKDPDVDEDYTMILNDGPLGFTLNGKGFPATEPLAVAQGDMVRIRYMNEGLQIHPMHLHGMPQKVIAKDGHLLPRAHFEDTVLVAPGERVDVLVEATEAGAWAWHCHILTHAESSQGMFGMVTAMVVE
jgi:uncharacterized cupredoxin-like copper-binding protein